jgi:RNA-directed DNA polymerase
MLRNQHVRFGGGRLETQVKLCAGRLPYFIISARSLEQLVEIRAFVAEFLADRGLELSPEKTKLTHIDEGFDFLGQNVRRYSGTLLIKPSKKNQEAFLEKVRTTIKDNPTLTSGKLIQKLNPMIRGWASYHRGVCSKKIYSQTDHQIFKTLWSWARRRHPKNKNAQWVCKKYFRTYGKRTWTFSGVVTGRDGKEKTVRLRNAASTPIRRHVKIKAHANPFDPEWEAYFEKRIQTKMGKDLTYKLLSLWQSQQGKCPACQQIINTEDGWHVHHVIWRSKGGGDQMNNLQLLHPACHRQIHAKRLKL